MCLWDYYLEKDSYTKPNPAIIAAKKTIRKSILPRAPLPGGGFATLERSH